MKQIPAPEIFSLLTQWALRPDASTDLRNIFGGDSDRYQPLLQSIRRGDFSWVPEVQILPAYSMGSADGAYSRETGSIYISSDCPADLKESVLLEEIGHHIDALFNEQETPGDEGTLFSATVRGITLTDEEITAILNEDDSALLSLNGHQVAVECAAKPAPPSRPPLKPIVTVSPGTKVNTPPPNDTITSAVSYDLSATADGKVAHYLILTGNSNLVGRGNALATNFLQANSGNTTLVAGTGTGSTTMIGGAGNNSLFARNYAGNLSVVGGAGRSTMVAGLGSAVLDASQNLSQASLIGGAKASTLSGSRGGGDAMVGGAGNDLFVLQNSLIGSVNGGAGNDTLRFSNAVTLGDSNLNRLGGIEALQLSDQSSVTLGDQARRLGLASVFGGSGSSSITQLAADTLRSYFKAGTGAMYLNIANSTLLGGNTIVGGTGRDTLQLSSTATLGDNSFANFTGIEVLRLSSPSSVTLGANSKKAGLSTLMGGDGNDTFTHTSLNGNSLTLIGGNGANLFNIANSTILNNDSIVGGTGMDSLVLSAASTLDDSSSFAKVRSVEVIQASSLAGNSITLGNNAQAGGVLSLFGGASSDILSAAGMTIGNIWIQGDSVGGSSTQGDTLAVGTGTSRATLVGNNSAAATNYFQISTAALLGNNSIVGGASSTDYLQITTKGQVLSDASFARVSGLDGLILAGGGNTITLGATAQAKFGSTVSLTGGADGGDTINLSATTKKVYLDASAGTTGDTITAGAKQNTLIGGSAATANDLFIFTSGSNLSGASVVGGGGTDTLRLSTNAQIISSDALSGLSSIEALSINGAGNKITLGNISAGIATIFGGTGPNTIDASDYSSAPNALTWNMNSSNGRDSLLGGTAGNLFQIKNVANLQNSIITGNIGNDTIQLLAGAQTIGDTAFTNSSSIEQLVLGSAANGNKLTLGTTAASKGIATIVGGTSKDTIDASALNSDIFIDAGAGTGARLIGSTTNTNTLIGGSGGGNEFILGSLGANSIVGGSDGLDTLTFNDTTTAVDFTSLSNIGTLKFNNAGNTVVLGEDALIAGIRTLVGGEGDDTGGDTFDASAYGSASVLFQITDQNYLANTTMVGGTGVDTVKFSRDGVSVTDEVVANLYNIDVLQFANGNNLFMLSDQFVFAGIDSIIGGNGRDTLDISNNEFYTPTPVSDVPGATSDVITFDARAGSGYMMVGTTQNFPFAKIVGGTSGGAVILDGSSLVDSDFVNMYEANAKTLTMRTASGVSVEVGLNAKGSGLTQLNMGGGDDQIDARAFAGTLAVSGGGGNDLLRTSFAALSDLTFTGSSGNDTLQIVGSNARSISTLKGDFDALVLNAGNNLVALGNDAGLSTIYGGSGVDTINMLANTTGICFVVGSEKLGSLNGFASLNGGAGSDTLILSSSPTGGLFEDSKFWRIGLKNLTGSAGGQIENFVTYSDPITGKGGSQYNLGTISSDAGIVNVFAHENDYLDAFDRGSPSSKAINFVFTDPNAIGNTTLITSDKKTDTLTLVTDSAYANNVSISDGFFGNKYNIEIFNFQNGNEKSGLDFDFGDNAFQGSKGIQTVIGGTGDDTLRFKAYESDNYKIAFIGGDGIDSAIISSTDSLSVSDKMFSGWSSVEKLTAGSGNNQITLASIAGGVGISTITGNEGNDTLNASAYTIAATLSGENGNDSLLSGTGNDSLSGGKGNDTLQGTSARSAGASQIDTLTGGEGNDWFVLGDAIRAYYDTPANAGDYALITDFTAGDKLLLKTLDNFLPAKGYLIDDIGSSTYLLYRDTNSNGLVESGTDNLIASITSTNTDLTTANLSTYGKFI